MTNPGLVVLLLLLGHLALACQPKEAPMPTVIEGDGGGEGEGVAVEGEGEGVEGEGQGAEGEGEGTEGEGDDCDRETCLPDGQPCEQDRECRSDHCGNGFCCKAGDCCAEAADCLAAYTAPPVCDEPDRCQGYRRDPRCDDYQCGTSEPLADDRACGGDREIDDCGLYPGIRCTGEAEQAVPVCPSNCETDGGCDETAHCDHGCCVADLTPGGFCGRDADCAAGIICVDAVCCTTACDGQCERCDLNGNGTCAPVPAGQDPDEECVAVSCDGHYFGWNDLQCLGRQSAAAELVGCDGRRGCPTAAQFCPTQPAGAAVLTCDERCQRPKPGTCSGTTPGACEDLEDQTCGLGECQRTMARCQAGEPVECVAGEPTEESCNGLDDDCDGQTDNGACVHCDESCSAPCNGCPAGTVVPAGWACVPAGTYTVGSPAEEVGRETAEIQHEVQLTRPYLMQTTEVTQADWLATMGSNPSAFRVGGGDGCNGDVPCDNRPVEQVNWYEVVAYCNARSLADGLERCYQNARSGDYDVADAAAEVTPTWSRGLACLGFRLPTEAEWEVAARAGTATATPAGDLDVGHLHCEQPNPTLDRIAWFCGNSSNRTHPVATRSANEWGLSDLLGNVWEWCWDRMNSYPAGPLIDPIGPANGSNRVIRGSSWFNQAGITRAALRIGYSPRSQENRVGFRLVRLIP